VSSRNAASPPFDLAPAGWFAAAGAPLVVAVGLGEFVLHERQIPD
jgi:hypothetical protein